MLYHLSEKPNLKQLTPRIPESTTCAEDRKIPRVCVASTIIGCLKAINPFMGQPIYVYAIIPDPGMCVVESSKLKWLVPDSVHTREQWILTPVKVERLGQLSVVFDGWATTKYNEVACKEYRAIEGIHWKWVRKENK